MNGKRQVVIFAISCALLSGVGCEKKKNASAVTGPKIAPTLSEPLPEGLPVEGTVPVETAKSEPPPNPPKTATKPKPRTRTHKPAATQQAPVTTAAASPQPTNEPPAANTTIASAKPPKNPADAAAEAAIGADVSAATVVAQKDKATRDIDAAESELKSLEGKTLPSDEQSIVSQVRAYISQSRKALTEGDYERAVNLANKAKLLSDALKKM